MTTEIIWQEPPVSETGKGRRGTGRLQKIDVELRKNPGKWALIAEGVSYAAVPPIFGGKEYERAYRNYTENGKKLRRIYVRYIGGNE